MNVPNPTRSARPSDEELQRRRQAIDRGLRRSYYAVLAASLMVGLFALAALWLSSEARHRAEDAHLASLRLWEFGSQAARLQRSRRAIGQRRQTLEIIREPARFKPSRELRDEALSALLLPDIGTNLAWHGEIGFEIPGAYDPDFAHFIQNNDRGRAIVRDATNAAAVMDEEGLGAGTPFWEFSPDGRLAAIAFNGGQIGVWDWRQKKLIARFPSIDDEFAEPPFDFAPDGQHLWVLDSRSSLRPYALENGKPGFAISLGHPARLVRLSPSGEFAAVACGTVLEIWDLAQGALRSSLTLTNDIWRVAWQPGQERLAIGGPGGLRLWDLGAPEAATLRGDDETRFIFFNADGDLLFNAGSHTVGEVWSVPKRCVVLQMSADSPLELGKDQVRLSSAHGRVGYGIQQFLPPAGIRHWQAPPSLASGFSSLAPRGPTTASRAWTFPRCVWS